MELAVNGTRRSGLAEKEDNGSNWLCSLTLVENGTLCFAVLCKAKETTGVVAR